MNILVTGRGVSGSWRIRGEQLGNAIGATVDTSPTELKCFDLAIVVKRPRTDLIRRLHDAKVPIVWDVVDAWPQPIGNDWDRERCMLWLRAELGTIRPAAIVAATRAMARDCEGFGLPVLALPHHARPGQRINPLRATVATVGYEGGDYLGQWREMIDRQCARRNWQFVVNPPELASVDIVVALRDKAGYAPRYWKSNVKLANAQGSKTPSVLNRESGYLETASANQPWADSEKELVAAFDLLSDWGNRKALVDGYEAPTLDGTARKYRVWLEAL